MTEDTWTSAESPSSSSKLSDIDEYQKHAMRLRARTEEEFIERKKNR